MENLYGYGKRIMGKAKKPKKKDPSEKVPTFYQRNYPKPVLEK